MRRILAAVSVLALLVGCAGPADTPEQRVRGILDRAEQAAEARDLGFFEEAVSPDYRDADGHTRKDLVRLLAGHFLRNRSVHLLVRIREVTPGEGGKIRAVVFVGMAGSPFEGLEQFLALRADLYRLDLAFDSSDEVRLASAAWRRASPQEL